MSSEKVTRPRFVDWMRNRAIRRLFLFRVLPVVVIVPLVLQLLLAGVIGKDPRLFPKSLIKAKNLLIVTAHPDDECLFFSPSILGVLEDNPETTGGLLVMSTGELVSIIS
jgi:N-acetylglucosaminylphosphatidylinositol deacetylase